MKKIVVIPDSFKGTMSSNAVGKIIVEEAQAVWPRAELVRATMADGGEGTLDAILATQGGKKYVCRVNDPRGHVVSAAYGIINDAAIIEIAQAAGLPLMGETPDPLHSNTYGVGQLIAEALNHHPKYIVIGLGGSATNDGGTGMAAALGVEFHDAEGNTFVPCGKTLKDIHKISSEELDPRLADVKIIGMCDIDNLLCGDEGAAAVFGPQKGATPEDVVLLDEGLQHLALRISKDLGKDVLALPGGGAAGGMGAGLSAFLSAELRSGIETMLDLIKFDEMVEGASLVISGEGKIDSQSVRGKVVWGIAQRTKLHDVPTIAFVGDNADDDDMLYAEGVDAIFSINRLAIPFTEARERAALDLRMTARNVFRFMNKILDNSRLLD